jgi:hypothetical protein
MRNEMNMMRNAYEKRISDLRSDMDKARREAYLREKELSEECKRMETSRDVAMRRLNALMK